MCDWQICLPLVSKTKTPGSEDDEENCIYAVHWFAWVAIPTRIQFRLLRPHTSSIWLYIRRGAYMDRFQILSNSSLSLCISQRKRNRDLSIFFPTLQSYLFLKFHPFALLATDQSKNSWNYNENFAMKFVYSSSQGSWYQRIRIKISFSPEVSLMEHESGENSSELVSTWRVRFAWKYLRQEESLSKE